MPFLPALLVVFALPVAAGAAELLPSAQLLRSQPDQLAPGRCVIYGESGASLAVPEYFGFQNFTAGEVPLLTSRSITQPSLMVTL